MYERSFRLSIVTPTRVVFDGEATSLSVPGVMGGFQVLYSHAPLLSSLEIGRMKVRDMLGTDEIFAAGGGVVEVRNNVVTVLVESAERIQEIDIERAKAARDRATKRLKSKDASIDVERARLALWRAVNRLRIAGGV